MIWKMESEVTIPGIGKIKHRHDQEFDDGDNVFGRVLEYHKYMYKTFPDCDFTLLEAKEMIQ